MRVPLVDLAAQEATVSDDVLAEIARVAAEARFILGAGVEKFEHWLAQTCGARHAIGVASGTDALELSLRALGVGDGDAVVTPALSFVAAAEAIALVGASPVFCDVDPATMNVTEQTVGEAIARARGAGMRVRAIVPVHLFGRCAPLEALASLASDEGLFLVEDAAQALGARDGSARSAGAVGDSGCFSFFPTKSLGAWGDAGAVVTSRDDIAARVRRLRVHGQVQPYVHGELGRNSRLDALQAAVLLAKTSRLATWQQARARIAGRYRLELERFPLLLPPVPQPPAMHAWHAFVVRSELRDALREWLRKGGVESRVYYPLPLHRQPCFAALGEPSLPAADEVCRTALALPMFATLLEDQQDYVIEQIGEFFRAHG
jgi:dTDP-4-amino-4,6-dideoxygalactose transaminase